MSASLQRGKGVPVRKLQLLTFPFMEVLLKTLILSFPSKDGDQSQISPALVITTWTAVQVLHSGWFHVLHRSLETWISGLPGCLWNVASYHREGQFVLLH